MSCLFNHCLSLTPLACTFGYIVKEKSWQKGEKKCFIFLFYKPRSLTCFLSAEYSLKHKDFCLGLQNGALSWCTLSPLSLCLSSPASLPCLWTQKGPQNTQKGLSNNFKTWAIKKIRLNTSFPAHIQFHLTYTALSENGAGGGRLHRKYPFAIPLTQQKPSENWEMNLKPTFHNHQAEKCKNI